MESTRTDILSYYSDSDYDDSRDSSIIRYRALERHTEETRADLITKGYAAKELSTLDVRILCVTNYVAEMSASSPVLRPIEKIRDDADRFFRVEREVSAMSFIQPTPASKIREIATKLLPLFKRAFDPKEIDMQYVGMHDPTYRKSFDILIVKPKGTDKIIAEMLHSRPTEAPLPVTPSDDR